MGLHQTPLSPPLTPSSTQIAVQQIISCSRLTVARSEDLPGHLHRICSIRLSDGSRLIVKSSPSPSLSLLRCENIFLDSEATILETLASSSLPIPQVLKYERKCGGSPFLVETYTSGSRLADVKEYLTRSEREGLEKQLQDLRSAVSEHRSFTYGPAGLVQAGRGFATWREAFVAMLESLLMDGEDINVNIPYYHIRDSISRWETYLDDVTEARLIVPGICEPRNVLIDRKLNEVTGLLDFGRAVWGDICMMEEQREGEIKGLLYTCYEAIFVIVRNNFRSAGDACELDARKKLTRALRQLAPDR